jgi:hypothetical protein
MGLLAHGAIVPQRRRRRSHGSSQNAGGGYCCSRTHWDIRAPERVVGGDAEEGDGRTRYEAPRMARRLVACFSLTGAACEPDCDSSFADLFERRALFSEPGRHRSIACRLFRRSHCRLGCRQELTMAAGQALRRPQLS